MILGFNCCVFPRIIIVYVLGNQIWPNHRKNQILSMPLTIGNAQFREIFNFHCPHASEHICYACWMKMLSSDRPICCPLCRTSSNKSVIPSVYLTDSYSRTLSYDFRNAHDSVTNYAQRYAQRVDSIDEMIRRHSLQMKRIVFLFWTVTITFIVIFYFLEMLQKKTSNNRQWLPR